MNSTTQEEIYRSITELLRRLNPDQTVGQIDEDANLFDAGLVDSLRVIEVMILVEQLTGRTGEGLGGVDPSSFYSLRAIYDAFFQTADVR